MKTITTLILSAVIVTSSMFAGQAAAGDYYGKQKVVYHINYDNPKAQAGALRNIQNHINAVGAENLDLVVVLHGNGLSLLLDPASLQRLKKFKHANGDQVMTAKVANLKNQGVSFAICNNTIKGRNVEMTDLYDVYDEDIVPSGVAQLSKLQQEGYTYIKP
ncbi:MAG: DsrE family protein [Gammaproteobacteria bacterium]|jgi:intracellular sulfur oxidation DsrE/DsrF family protein